MRNQIAIRCLIELKTELRLAREVKDPVRLSEITERIIAAFQGLKAHDRDYSLERRIRLSSEYLNSLMELKRIDRNRRRA